MGARRVRATADALPAPFCAPDLGTAAMLHDPDDQVLDPSPVVCIHLFVTLALLIGGGGIARAGFQQYLIHLTPLALLDVLIRKAAMSAWGHPSASTTSPWRAVALVYFRLARLHAGMDDGRASPAACLPPHPEKRGRQPEPDLDIYPGGAVPLLAGGVSSWLARGKGYRIPVLLGFATVERTSTVGALPATAPTAAQRSACRRSRSTKQLAVPLHEQRRGDLD